MRNLLRAVLDANVFVSGFHFGGVPRLILEAAIANKFQIVASLENRMELDGVLKSKFAWTDEDLAELESTFWSLVN